MCLTQKTMLEKVNSNSTKTLVLAWSKQNFIRKVKLLENTALLDLWLTNYQALLPACSFYVWN